MYNHILVDHNSGDDFSYIFKLLSNTFKCISQKCKIIKRNGRNRHLLNNNYDDTISLYCNLSEEKQQISKFIIVAELIDRMHCHSLHSYGCGYRTTQEKRDI